MRMDHLKPIVHEDFSHLNPKQSARASAAGKAARKNITPDQRARLAAAGRANRGVKRIQHA